jgi:proline dehydrogenase
MVFTDTQIAYRLKTDSELKKALKLFRMMRNPLVSGLGVRVLRAMFKIGLPIGSIIKATLFKHFIGGKTIEEGSSLVDRLYKFNVSGILDYATEDKDSETEIQSTIKELHRNLEFASNNPAIPFSVFKPSAFASSRNLEKFSSGKELAPLIKAKLDLMRQRYFEVFTNAANLGVPLMADAEESWTQPIVDQLVMEMMGAFNKEQVIAVNTFQLYRNDRLDYLKKSWEISRKKNFLLGAKLVRGAYIEKERLRAYKMDYPSPVYDTKMETDNAYNEAIKFCVEHIEGILLFMGSHNEYSNKYLMKLMEENGLPRNHPNIWFSQLYGMCDHITNNLAAQGYNVCKYIPYGKIKIVIPYLLRRAEENSSITDQSAQEIELLRQEIIRRSMK